MDGWEGWWVGEVGGLVGGLVRWVGLVGGMEGSTVEVGPL